MRSDGCRTARVIRSAGDLVEQFGEHVGYPLVVDLLLRQVGAEQLPGAAAGPARFRPAPGTRLWPVRLVELNLKGIRQLLPDQIAKAGSGRFRKDHPQVRIACVLTCCDDLVEGAAQRAEGSAANDRHRPDVGPGARAHGDDKRGWLVRLLAEVDRQRRP